MESMFVVVVVSLILVLRKMCEVPEGAESGFWRGVIASQKNNPQLWKKYFPTTVPKRRLHS